MSLIYGPSTRSLRTVIAREAPTLRSQLLDSHGGAFVVVLVPGQKRYVGPMALTSYVAHRHGGPKIAELAELEKTYRSLDEIEAAVKRWEVPQ